MGFETLSLDDVVLIHHLLAEHFAAANDPIYPAGVKSADLLASAVARQHTSIGGVLKYDESRHNAAALAYGLCCNHPFHNGNKRTALVAMLVHLDRNRFIMRDVGQDALFDIILKVASHELAPKRKGLPDSDSEVRALHSWILKTATKVERGEKPITGRELRRILRRFGLELGTSHSNTVDVMRPIERRGRWPWSKPTRDFQRVCTIGWHHEGGPVAPRDIRRLRQLAHLSEADGVDTRSFYDDEAIVDSFINEYRTILRKLSRR